MKIVNTSLRNAVQAKIDALTATTPLKDLMLLAKTAKGLNCNTLALDALITARLNELSAGSSVAEVLMGSAAAGLVPDPVGLLAVSNGAKSADPLWVDCFGTVYSGAKFRTKATQHNGTVTSSTVLNAYIPLNGIKADSSNGNSGFSAVLSDGNLLIGDGDNNNSSYGMRLRLLSADYETVLNANAGVLAFIDASSFPDPYARLMAVYKVSENTFRLYYRYCRNGETTTSNLGFQLLSYNPATKAVTIGNRTQVSTTGTNASLVPLTTQVLNTERYLVIRHDHNSYHYVIDLQLGTSTEFLAARAKSVTMTNFIGTGTDCIAYAAFTTGTPVIVKTDGSSVNAPAALVTDGSMATSRSFAHLSKGVFLAVGNSVGTVKIVKFSADYSAVVITTLATDPMRVPSGGNLYIICQGRRFYVQRSAGTPFSLEIDASGNPEAFRWEEKTLRYQSPAINAVGPAFPVYDAGQVFHYICSFSGWMNNATIFTGPLAEFMKMVPSVVGCAAADAVAGTLCPVVLSAEVQQSSVPVYDLHKPWFSGYIRSAEQQSESVFETLGGAISGSSAMSYAVEMVNRSGTLSSVNTGVLLPASRGVIYGNDGSSFTYQVCSIFGADSVFYGAYGMASFKSELPLMLYSSKPGSSILKIFN